MRASDFAYLDAPTPVALAHRGGAAYGPNRGVENTMAAFRRAVEMGYCYLETDVHATKDGQLVAFHDTVLDRVSDVSGAVEDLPYNALREVRIGGTEPIPLLRELFAAFPGVRVNIDIKADGRVQKFSSADLRYDWTDGDACVRDASKTWRFGKGKPETARVRVGYKADPLR